MVAGFNAFQYALDVELALTEACRVATGGRVAISKYGRPADNEFFAFLAALEPHGPQLEQLGGSDAVERAIGRLGLDVTSTGDVLSTMSLPDDGALATALPPSSSSARVLTAGAPYRRSDGTYRFENRMRYWVVSA